MTDRNPQISQLGYDIRASAETHEPVETELATNQRIIARVTDGIYREPWAAFRELIANAYDADATSVVIETGLPNFEQVVVRDNGSGMTPETLAYVLQSIGGSSKRTHEGIDLQTSAESNTDRSPDGRLLIGKIGIGLFAVAQLTQHFQIITKARGEKIRSSATVRLQTHDEDRLSRAKPDSNYVAGTVVVTSEAVTEDEIQAQGTTVVLYSLRPEIRRSLQSARRWLAVDAEGIDGKPVTQAPIYHIGNLPARNEPTEPNLPWGDEETPFEKFRSLFQAASAGGRRAADPSSLEHFDNYFQLIWKLSLSLPLTYLTEHPFDISGSEGVIFFDVPDGRSQSEQITLEPEETIRSRLGLETGEHDPCGGFGVLIDGIELRRPIELPHNLLKPSRIGAPVMMVAKETAPFKDEDLDRAGGPLSFEAYLYWNSQIVPKDTQGVLIRVREASGTLFDPSFLNYQISEQTRLRQITAEIFIRDGLDSAINIDRESFNFSHPHYLYLQRWLHKALRLIANRLKAISSEDLRFQREREGVQARKALAKAAFSVWSSRQGETADPPVSYNLGKEPPLDVGGAEIDWIAEPLEGEVETASAVAVVLEAYGLLSHLSSKDRARVINDILNIFRAAQ